MKFKIGFLASVPLTTDTELVATTVRYRQCGERQERAGVQRNQYRACLQTVADATGQEDEPRTRHCLLPNPAGKRVCGSPQRYKCSPAAEDDASASRGRCSSTSSSESSNTNSGDSISFNSTNSSGSTCSTGNSLASSSGHNTDTTCIRTSNTSARSLFIYGRKNDIRKRRIGPSAACVPPSTPDRFAGHALTLTTTDTAAAAASLELSISGKADTGGSATQAINLKTNSLSSNSSCDSQTSSNSSTKSFRKFFHRGNVFSSSLKIRNKIKKQCNNNNGATTSTTTTTTTTTVRSSSSSSSSSRSCIANINSSSSSTENSRFLLPADSVTNIVVVGDKGVGKSAVTVRFLTRRYIGEYSSEAEMMYEHDTLVDHAPACLHLLDVTTLQTPYQILNHLSWAHAFVVVYDVTSRASFIHARQLLQIINSCSRTPPRLAFHFPPKPCSCKADDCHPRPRPRPDLSHERARNVSVWGSNGNAENGNGGRIGAGQETWQLPLSLASVAAQPPRALRSFPHAGHPVSPGHQAEPPPSGHSCLTPSSLPVSPYCWRGPGTYEDHRSHRPVVSRPHRSASPCYGSSRGALGDRHFKYCHCHCHDHHTTLYGGTTLDAHDSAYNKTLIPSHSYCDSTDKIPVTEHVSFDCSKGKNWSPEKVRRVPLNFQRNFGSCEGRERSDCVQERYARRPSFHHSCNRLFPNHAALAHPVCLPVRGSCPPTSPSRKHTTLLLGNKRDLEHIRRVWTDEGEALSLEFSCQFYEVSAAESLLGVHLAFHSLLKEARALQLIRSLPRGSSQGSSKGTVSSTVSKVIGNFFRVGKVGHKRQSNSI